MGANTKKSITKKVYFLVLLPVPVIFLIYAGILIGVTWPISELSVSKSGVFGDSFGPLTALFSGLAFAGMILTILLQKHELELQREELSKSSKAQATNAQLNALATLLDEYRSRMNDIDRETRDAGRMGDQFYEEMADKYQKTKKHKDRVVASIEEILFKSFSEGKT